MDTAMATVSAGFGDVASCNLPEHQIWAQLLVVEAGPQAHRSSLPVYYGLFSLIGISGTAVARSRAQIHSELPDWSERCRRPADGEFCTGAGRPFGGLRLRKNWPKSRSGGLKRFERQHKGVPASMGRNERWHT